MKLLCGSILKDRIILTFGERKKGRKKTCTSEYFPAHYATVKSRAKSKQLAFCSARQFLLAFMWRGACKGWKRWRDSDNDAHKWNCDKALPSSSRTKAHDSLISQHKKNMRKNKGIFGSPSTLCVCERGNSIGGDFRCGCTFIAGHFKANHHACVAHHGWLRAHYFAGASLFSIVQTLGNFMIWSKQRCLLTVGVSRCCRLHHGWKKEDLCEEKLMSEEMCKREGQWKE